MLYNHPLVIAEPLKTYIPFEKEALRYAHLSSVANTLKLLPSLNEEQTLLKAKNCLIEVESTCSKSVNQASLYDKREFFRMKMDTLDSQFNKSVSNILSGTMVEQYI